MHRFLDAALAVSLLISCPAWAQPQPASGMDPARLARIPKRMRQFVDQGLVSGAVGLVQRHGKTVFLDAAGMRDVENKKPMQKDSIFQVMSMTKPVTAVGIMILVDEGLLVLNAPVADYLPEFRGITVATGGGNRNPARLPTVRDLLTHTSGMGGPEASSRVYHAMDIPLADAVKQFAAEPLEFDPGTKWRYSNAGIATLGRIIEVVSRQPYEQFIAERVFQPLGMKDSFFFAPEDRKDRIALVYTHKDGKLTAAGGDILGGDPRDYRKGAKYPAPEFGLYSTAADLAAFYQMMLNSGSYGGKRLISKAAVETMTMVHTGDLPAGWAAGSGFGLGFEVTKDPVGTLAGMSIGTFHHGGAFATFGWIDRAKDLVGVWLVQLAGSADPQRMEFIAMANAAVEGK